jgi:hypothetical protein
MLRQKLPVVFLMFLVWVPTSLYADDARIKVWVQKTLLSTLSISYATPDTPELQTRYTENAWEAIHGFLQGYLEQVQREQLILHPLLNGPATLTTTGTIHSSNFFNGVQYWQVQQIINIPELGAEINFSVVVIDNPSDNAYKIQSLDMSMME